MKTENMKLQMVISPHFGAARSLLAALSLSLAGPLTGQAFAQCTVDTTGNGFDTTLAGGAGCAAGRNGTTATAITFNGVDAYAESPVGELSQDVFSEGGTVSAWIYPTGWGELNLGRILSKGEPEGSTTLWTLAVSGSMRNVFFKRGFSAQEGYWQTPLDSMTLNAWHHVAVVYDDSSSSNDPVIYIDGVPQSLTEVWAPSGTPLSDQTYALGIGNVSALTRAFQGKIEGIGFNRLASTPQEIKLAYAERGDWKLDEGQGATSADSSAYLSTATISGATWATGAEGSALEFDGIDDSVAVANHSERNNLFSGGGSVAAWFFATGWGESNAGRIAQKADAAAATAGWALSLNNSGGNLQSLEFKRAFSGGAGAWNTPTGSIKLNAWNHVVVVYNDASAANSPTIYLNGQAQSLTTRSTPTGSALTDAAQSLYIGNNQVSGSATFKGKIESLRLLKTDLPASDVLNAYEAVPEALIPVVALTFDEASGTVAADSATLDGAQNGTLVNAPTPVAGQFGNALSFDGTDDKVTLAGPALGSSFAVSAWIYPIPGSESSAVIVAQAGGGIALMYKGATRNLSFYYAGADHFSSTAMTENQWHHIAVVCNAGNLTFYLDGVADGAAAGAPSWSPTSIGDGGSSNNNFKGLIDQLQIFNRAVPETFVELLGASPMLENDE